MAQQQSDRQIADEDHHRWDVDDLILAGGDHIVRQRGGELLAGHPFPALKKPLRHCGGAFSLDG